MAKIKFDVELKNLKGDQIKGPDNEIWTLGDACKNALLSYDEKASGNEKYEAFQLSMKIDSAPADGVDLKAEEITKIKNAVGRTGFPLLVGIVWNLLEGKDPYKSVKV